MPSPSASTYLLQLPSRSTQSFSFQAELFRTAPYALFVSYDAMSFTLPFPYADAASADVAPIAMLPHAMMPAMPRAVAIFLVVFVIMIISISADSPSLKERIRKGNPCTDRKIA